MVSAEPAAFSLKPCDLANTLHLTSSYILKPCICNMKIYHLSATHLSDCWTQNFCCIQFFILPYSLLLLDKEFQANLYLMSIQALEPWKVYQIFQSNLNQFENKSALRAKSWPCQLLDNFSTMQRQDEDVSHLRRCRSVYNVLLCGVNEMVIWSFRQTCLFLTIFALLLKKKKQIPVSFLNTFFKKHMGNGNFIYSYLLWSSCL